MKNNSAARFHALMTEWKTIKNHTHVVDGWSSIFGITNENEARKFALVSDRLHLLIDEFDLLAEKLYQRGITPSVYKPTLQKLNKALTPALLVQGADNLRQHLSEDVYVGLSYCSEILGDEENSISAEDFSAIVGLINQLELMLQDSTLPASLVILIRRHIRLAELAIAQYQIRGASAFKEAVKYAIGDLALESDVLRAAGEEKADAFRQLWKKANDVADGAIKADNLAQLGSRAMKLLSDFMNQ